MLAIGYMVTRRTCLAVPVLPDRPPVEPEVEDPDEPEEPRPPVLPPPLRFSNEFVVVSSMRSFSDNALTLVLTSASRRDIS